MGVFMSNKEAGSLIIKSIAIFEDVCKEYDAKIGPDIYGEISKLVATLIQSNQWAGTADLWNEDDLWFAPFEWKTAENEEDEGFKASYNFDLIKNSKSTSHEDYIFHISPILGIGSTQAGFTFNLERKNIGNPKAGDLKKFCQSHFLYNELSERGFMQINNGDWFIPFKLDPDALADAYANDTIVDALQPIVDVLVTIQDAHTLFMQLLDDVEAKYNL